jgi:hypothetical protein
VLGIDLIESFVMSMRPVVIDDRTTGTPFNTRRGEEATLADRCRGDIAGLPAASVGDSSVSPQPVMYHWPFIVIIFVDPSNCI